MSALFAGGTRLFSVLMVMLGLLFAAPRAAAQDDGGLEALNTANGLLNRGLHDLAAAEYAKFLEAHPQHEQANVARYGLAVCQLHAEHFADALKQIDQIELKPEFTFRAETLAMAGQCHLALREYDEAAQALQKLIREFGTHALADDAAALLCETFYRHGRFAEAARECDVVAKRWPESPLLERVGLVRGLCDSARGDSAAAIEKLTVWLTRYSQSAERERGLLALAQAEQAAGRKEAEAHYREILTKAKSPFAPDALLGLASLLREKGSGAEALKLLDQLQTQSPSAALTGPAEIQRGRLLYDAQKFAEAQAVFERLAAGKEAVAAEAGYWSAKCALRLGKPADAAARLEKLLTATAAASMAAEIRYDLAVAQMRGGKLDDAQRTLAALRQDFPKHPLAGDALYLAAVVEHQRRDYAASRALCVELLEKYAKHESAAQAAFLLGENEYLSEHWPEARAAFARFEKAYPSDPQIQKAALRVGLILYRQEQLDQAVARLAPLAEGADKDEALRPALLVLGSIAFGRSDWKTAEQHLRRFVTAQPAGSGADEAWLKLGLACERQERYEDALQAFDAVATRFPDTPHKLHAQFERGQCLLLLKQLDQARQAFETVISEGKETRFAALANEHLATIAARKGDLTQAAVRYQLAADAAPEGDSSDALLRRGEILIAAGKFAEAEQALTTFVERHPKSEQKAAAIAQLVLARSHLDRPADALDTLKKLTPRDLEHLTPELARSVRHEQAFCLRKLDRAADAAQVYRQLLAQPNGDRDWHAVLGLAEIDAAAERFEPAVDGLRKLRAAAADANAVPPELLEPAFYQLGVCEYRLKHFPLAAEALDALLKASPQSALAASAGYFSGESHFQAGKLDLAVERLTQVAKTAAKDPVVDPALLRLGEALALLQRWPQSEQVFADYLDRFADGEHCYQARFGIGWARENQGKLDAARQAYAEVIAKHKGATAARAQFQIGECLFAAKNYADAVREFLKVDINYAYPEWSAAALYEAGRCFEQLGKAPEARQSYTAVVEKHKDTRWAELASQRLSAQTATGLPGK